MSEIITIVQISNNINFTKNDGSIYFKEITTTTLFENISTVELEAWVKDDIFYDTTLYARAKRLSNISSDSGWSDLRRFQIQGNKWYLEHAGLIKRWDTSKPSTVVLENDNYTINSIKCLVSGDLLKPRANIPEPNKGFAFYKYPGIGFDLTKKDYLEFTPTKAQTIALVVEINTSSDNHTHSLIGGLKSGNIYSGLQLKNNPSVICVSESNKSYTNKEAVFSVNGNFTLTKVDSNDTIHYNKGAISIITATLLPSITSGSQPATLSRIGSIFSINNGNTEEFFHGLDGTIYDICLFDKALVGESLNKVIGILAHQWNKIFPTKNIINNLKSNFPYKSKIPTLSEPWKPTDIPGLFITLDPVNSTFNPPNNNNIDYFDNYNTVTDSNRESVLFSSENRNTNIYLCKTPNGGKHFSVAYPKYLKSTNSGLAKYTGPRTIILVEKKCYANRNGVAIAGTPNEESNVSDPASLLFVYKDNKMLPYPNLPFTSANYRIHLLYQKGLDYNPENDTIPFIRLNGADKIELPSLEGPLSGGYGGTVILGKSGDTNNPTLGNTTLIGAEIPFFMIYLGELNTEEQNKLIRWIAIATRTQELLPGDFPYNDTYIPYHLVTRKSVINGLNDKILLNETKFFKNINVNDVITITGNIFKEENRNKLEILSIFDNELYLNTNVSCSNGGKIKLSNNGDYVFTFDQKIYNIHPGSTANSNIWIKLRDIATREEQVYIVTFKLSRTDIGSSIVNSITNNVTLNCSSTSVTRFKPLRDLEQYGNWLKIKSINEFTYPHFNHYNSVLLDGKGGILKVVDISSNEIEFNPTKSTIYKNLKPGDPPVIVTLPMVVGHQNITKTINIVLSVSHSG